MATKKINQTKQEQKQNKVTEKKSTSKPNKKKSAVKSKAILKEVNPPVEKQKWETNDTPKNTVGRPQKFDADKAIQLMQKEIDKYLNGHTKYYDIVQKDPEGKKPEMIGVPYPSIKKMALMCGVDGNTFVDHCTAKNDDGSIKNEQLFRTYRMFKDLGEVMLSEGGLTGVYDAKIVQFLGNVNYGMIPNSKTETTVEIKSMDAVYKDLDSIYNKEQQRLAKQKAEAEERKRLFDEELHDE